MEIKITYRDRELNFDSPAGCGQGINSFLQLVKKNKNEIKMLYLSGQSSSFTFSRQVYLLVNLIRYLLDCDLYIDRQKIPKGHLAKPTY
jgi:hypothetical protein